MKYTDTLKTKKSLIGKISKRLIEVKFNNNKDIKKGCQKSIAFIIKHGLKCKKARLIVLVVKILHTILKKTKK